VVSNDRTSRAVLSPKLAGYGLLACVGLFVGLATHRPEIVLLGAPFAFGLAAGLSAVHRPSIEVGASLSAERVLEGDGLDLDWTVESERPLGHVELTMSLPLGLDTANGEEPLVALDIERPGSTTAKVGLRSLRWGRWAITSLAWQMLDPGRFVSYEGVVDHALVVQVHPTPEHLREIVEPEHTSVATGAHTSRAAGKGIEFAEVRPFTPGEHLRGVNWRATARHGGELWINRQHLERNADIVLLVDSLNDDALIIGVRAALRLATAYSGERDRIGVISFGGTLRWVAPGTGLRHLYRVLDALLITSAVFSYVWKDPAVVPARTLPTGALVFVISPLDDERAVATVRNLRGRGIDLAVIEIAPPGIAEPGPTAADQVAYRLWRLHREARRSEFEALGVPVVTWSGDGPLAERLSQITAFRRGPRRRVA
jgi:uncharacterized protein (DUF58 family)